MSAGGSSDPPSPAHGCLGPLCLCALRGLHGTKQEEMGMRKGAYTREAAKVACGFFYRTDGPGVHLE